MLAQLVGGRGASHAHSAAATDAVAAPAVADDVVIAADAGAEAGLYDVDHALSPRVRLSLEAHLRAATHETGRSISVEILARLPRQGSIAAVARQAFEDHSLAARGSDPVLLALALRERLAAIETGKGEAGIVPEIDARAICARLTARLGHGSDRARLLGPALDDAINRMAASVKATAERRRPLPSDDTDDGAPLGPAARGAGAPKSSPEPHPGGAQSPASGPGARHRSLLPTAGALAGLLVVALAIRQRRREASAREASASARMNRP